MIDLQLSAIQERLALKSDPSRIPFFEKMVPGEQKIYGVKTPELNLIAKEYKEGGFALTKLLWNSGALEEKIIAIKILEQIGKKDIKQTLQLVKQFAKKIDNWAVCDGLGMQALNAVRKTHAGEIFAMAEQYNHSKDPWQRRLSLVMVEWYTRDPACHARIKTLVKNLKNDKEYYVQKAILWIERNLAKGK
jgi:3-methyladenine DNA glycosylase AlkD